jgi:hypothetical protein
MQFSSLPINSSLQNNPRYKFSLKSDNIEILPILSAAILKMAAPIARGALRPWNFQNGRRCYGNLECMSKSLTSLILETTKGRDFHKTWHIY